MKPFIAFGILSTFVLASPSHALFGDSYISGSLDVEKSSAILVEKLRQIDNFSYKMGNMLNDWMELSRKEAHLCDQYHPETQPVLNLRCVKNDLIHVTKKTFRDGQIDGIEKAGVLLLVNNLTLDKDHKITVGEIKPTLFQRLFNRRQKKPNIPMVGSYESSSSQLRALRKANGQPENLDPTVLELLRKAYHRKVFGKGRVNPDQYILSKYSFAQIKKMSGMIAETMLWTDEQATAQLVIDRTGLTQKKAELMAKISTYTTEALAGTDAETLKPLAEEIQTLQKEVETLDTLTKIYNLKLQLFQLAQNYAETQDEETGEQIELLNDQIDELEIQLGNEMIVINIDAANLHRVAMNHLEIEISQEQHKATGLLKNFDGNIADMLTCAYLTGQVDGETLKHLLDQKEFKEIRESFLLKAGKVVWAASRMYLMMNPYTVIPTTLISVAIGAYQKKKAVYNEMSQKTYLFR